MTQALTPELALEYVRELSADVRAAIVLDGTGALLAGPPELAEPARALLAAGGDAAELEAGSNAGVVCAVRSPAHAAIAVCGRFAIAGVVREDLRAAIAALDGRVPAANVPAHRPPRQAASPAGVDTGTLADAGLLRAAEALIFAAQRPSKA